MAKWRLIGGSYVDVDFTGQRLVNGVWVEGSSSVPDGYEQQTVSVTGLTAGQNYYIHYVHVDAAGNESNVVSSAQFTTDPSSVLFSRSRVGYRAGSRQVI